MNTFVYEIGCEEKDLDKREKIDALKMTPPEWTRVKQFLDLLAVSTESTGITLQYLTPSSSKHADRAQQAFSSETEPSLHIGLPALEALHRAWSTRAKNEKYSRFADALNDGISYIAEYYQKTRESDAYIFSMCKL